MPTNFVTSLLASLRTALGLDQASVGAVMRAFAEATFDESAGVFCGKGWHGVVLEVAGSLAPEGDRDRDRQLEDFLCQLPDYSELTISTWLGAATAEQSRTADPCESPECASSLELLRQHQERWAEAHLPRRTVRTQLWLRVCGTSRVGADGLVTRLVQTLAPLWSDLRALSPRVVQSLCASYQAIAFGTDKSAPMETTWVADGATNPLMALSAWWSTGEEALAELDEGWFCNQVFVGNQREERLRITRACAPRAALFGRRPNVNNALWLAARDGATVLRHRQEVALRAAAPSAQQRLAQRVRAEFLRCGVALRPMSARAAQALASAPLAGSARSQLSSAEDVSCALALPSAPSPTGALPGGLPVQLPLGQRGELSLFDGAGANTVIHGAAGSGKTFLANAMVLRHCMDGGFAWVFRYRANAVFDDFMDTQAVWLHPGSACSLNPFSLVTSNYHWEGVRHLLLEWVRCLGRLESADAQGAGMILEQALDEAWHTWQAETTLGRLLEVLRGRPTLGRALAKRLADQLKGLDPAWFEGWCDLGMGPARPFTSFDASGFEHSPLLAPLAATVPVLYTLALEQAPRQQPKLLVLDEAWSLGPNHEALSRLVEACLRLQRRNYSGVVAVGLSPEGLEIPGSVEHAFFEAATHRILLGHHVMRAMKGRMPESLRRCAQPQMRLQPQVRATLLHGSSAGWDIQGLQVDPQTQLLLSGGLEVRPLVRRKAYLQARQRGLDRMDALRAATL